MTDLTVEIELICTCDACPTQYEGNINDTPFYFRYRFGRWSLTMYTDVGDKVWSGILGDEYDGVMKPAKVRQLIAESVRELWPDGVSGGCILSCVNGKS